MGWSYTQTYHKYYSLTDFDMASDLYLFYESHDSGTRARWTVGLHSTWEEAFNTVSEVPKDVRIRDIDEQKA